MSLVILPQAQAFKKGHPIAVIENAKGHKSPRRGHLLTVVDDEDGDSVIDAEPTERFCILPEHRPGMRSTIMICGASGCGKSTLAADFSRMFLELNPGAAVSVISSVDDADPAFEGIDHTRTEIDETLDELSVPELSASSDGCHLVVFDDVEGVSAKKKKALERFQQRCLETGRKLGVHVLSIHHKPANSNATKSALAEASGLVFFPKANSGNLGYALKTHFGLNPAIKALLKQPGWGRWAMISTSGEPSYILAEKRASLYDSDEIDKALKKSAARERLEDAARIKQALRDEGALPESLARSLALSKAAS